MSQHIWLLPRFRWDNFKACGLIFKSSLKSTTFIVCLMINRLKRNFPFISLFQPIRPSHDEGVILVATGHSHRQEAINSVPKLRSFLSGRPIWLYTDVPEDIPNHLFDKICFHPDVRHCYRDKIVPLSQLPFRKTLFLDNDVHFLQQIEDVFRILNVFDVVACHAPVRWCQWCDPDVPEGICELNTGVLGFRRSALVNSLLSKWLSIYDSANVAFDQASFRSALWWAANRGLQIWVLPPEYNLRTPKPWLVGPGMTVKIVHGRIPTPMLESLKIYLNNYAHRFRASSSFPTLQNSTILQWPPDPRLRIFVIGSGRSGTSLVAGLFRNSGLYMGDNSYLTRSANPKGFFEDRGINSINEAIILQILQSDHIEYHGWLAQIDQVPDITVSPTLRRSIRQYYSRTPSLFKDPRFVYTLPFWLRELESEDLSGIRCICVFRHPMQFLESVKRELSEAPYLSGLMLTDNQILNIWRAQYISVLRLHDIGINIFFVEFKDIINREKLSDLEAYTGLSVDSSFVDSSLQRSLTDANFTPPFYMEIYSRLQQIAH